MPRKARLMALFLALFTVVAASPSATAQEEKGLFGIGIIVGEPIGVSAKYYLSNDTAIDAAVGTALAQGGLHAHSDFLWHPYVLEKQDAFVLPFYVGPGVRLLFDNRDRGEEDVFHIGLRAVVGVLFDFRNVPLDVFIEVAPIADYRISNDANEDGFGFAINAGAGVRYWF